MERFVGGGGGEVCSDWKIGDEGAHFVMMRVVGSESDRWLI